MACGKSHLLAVRRALAFTAVAAFLTLSINSASARNYPCWMIRAYVATHTCAEIDAKANEYNATPDERQHAMACLSRKERRKCGR